MRELTEKQRLFAENYVTHGVASRAAVHAGYSPKRADQQGYGLLNEARFKHVQDYIAALRAKSADKAGVAVDAIVDELKTIAFADLTDFVEWGPMGVRLKDSKSLDALRRRAIIEVRQSPTGGLSIKLADKLGALKALGDYREMFSGKKPEDEEPPAPVHVSINVVDASVPRAHT